MPRFAGSSGISLFGASRALQTCDTQRKVPLSPICSILQKGNDQTGGLLVQPLSVSDRLDGCIDIAFDYREYEFGILFKVEIPNLPARVSRSLKSKRGRLEINHLTPCRVIVCPI